MFPIVVADIGGTNARFSLVTGRDSAGRYQFSYSQNYLTADFFNFSDCLADYLKSFPEVPRSACIAIAGPVVGDEVSFTNNTWQFSIAAIKETFAFDVLQVINDFEALAACLSHLQSDDVITVYGDDLPPEGMNKAVVGPGTGFGVAGLIAVVGEGAAKWQTVASEGGHCAFSPQNPRELAVHNYVHAQMGYVTWEDILSGRGLVNVYRALLELEGDREGEGLSPQEISPSTITDAALEETSGVAVDTVKLFCEILAGVCADVALLYGARGGIYLGGGILPRILPFLMATDFRARFLQGTAGNYLVDIPVYLIVQKQPALIGAAAFLEQASNK